MCSSWKEDTSSGLLWSDEENMREYTRMGGEENSRIELTLIGSFTIKTSLPTRPWAAYSLQLKKKYIYMTGVLIHLIHTASNHRLFFIRSLTKNEVKEVLWWYRWHKIYWKALNKFLTTEVLTCFRQWERG